MDEHEERAAYEAWRDGLVHDPAFADQVAALAARARHGEIPPDERTLEERLGEHLDRRSSD